VNVQDKIEKLSEIRDNLTELFGGAVKLTVDGDWVQLNIYYKDKGYTLSMYIDQGYGRSVLDWWLSDMVGHEYTDSGRGAIDREIDTIGDLLDMLP